MIQYSMRSDSGLSPVQFPIAAQAAHCVMAKKESEKKALKTLDKAVSSLPRLRRPGNRRMFSVDEAQWQDR
jgi:hypothetical protein